MHGVDRWRSAAAAWALHLWLLGLTVAVFDTLLLRRYLDRPEVLIALLALVWVSVALTSLVVRRLSDVGGLLSVYRRVDWPALVLLGCLGVLLLVFHQNYDRASSDGRDYFVQTRSMVFDRDFQMDEEIAHFRTNGQATVYPIGTAILWLPFYLAGHAWLDVLRGVSDARDGYGNPYQMAVGVGTVVYGFIALILIYRLLSQYFSRALSLAASILLYAGSFVVWYLSVKSSMNHGASLFATTLFLYVWHQTRHRRTLAQWVLLGGLAGLMSMVRWQDGLFMLVPAIEALRDYWRAVTRSDTVHVTQLMKRHACFIGMAVVVFTPQLAFWSANPELFSLPASAASRSYDETALSAVSFRYGGTQWANPQISNVLFSSNHGLLASTPLLYLAVIGLVVFVGRAPFVGGLLATGFLVQLYVNSVSVAWWGGAGFGARRFTSSALIFAIGLAALIDWWRRRPAVPTAVILATFLLSNAFVMLEVNRGRLPTGTGISFESVFDATYRRLGNPFSFPANLWFTWRYGASPVLYDRIGLRSYNTIRIDLGEPDDDQFLARGWSGREQGPDRSWRWAVATESSVIVPLRAARYQVLFRAEAFRFPDAPDPSVTLLVNRHRVQEVWLAEGLQDYAIDIPAEYVRAYMNEIAFVYRYAVSPQSLGLSDDARPLAVAFDSITVTRASERTAESDEPSPPRAPRSRQ